MAVSIQYCVSHGAAVREQHFLQVALKGWGVKCLILALRVDVVSPCWLCWIIGSVLSR